ncbi:hypothetical protein TGFOU_214545 [Toxoplasma gondii FOU]|uniref:Uncharacterized protein n=3 Tax=Toxoplasma gondii TaxID=5811 RepID=A0A086K3V8_TOXGO|nr:hypothetical protein TGFOU_214545 [Toxoplasma gondii FOU]PUA86440.1 hypothetical protein TGBR9_214545 [Toxoplasma gondii TgCATBr9]RQX69981.1 hypothetical protein TGCAST_214545 [Toxoplasma gondii CAST]
MLRGKRDASLSPPSQLRDWCRRNAHHASTDQCASGIASFLAAEQPGQTQQFDQYLAIIHEIQDLMNPGLRNYIEVFLLLEGMPKERLKLFTISTWLCVLFCYTQGCVEEEVLYKVLKRLKLDAHIVRRAVVYFISSEQKMDLAVQVSGISARLRSGRTTTEKKSNKTEAVEDPCLGSSWQPLLNELGCETGPTNLKITRAVCAPKSGKQVYTSTCATKENCRISRGDHSNCSAADSKPAADEPAAASESTCTSCLPLQNAKQCLMAKVVKEEANPSSHLYHIRKLEMEPGSCASVEFPSKKRRTQALRYKIETQNSTPCKKEDPGEGSFVPGADSGMSCGEMLRPPHKRDDAYSKRKLSETPSHDRKHQPHHNTRRITTVPAVKEEANA